jgi:hypothetical protein
MELGGVLFRNDEKAYPVMEEKVDALPTDVRELLGSAFDAAWADARELLGSTFGVAWACSRSVWSGCSVA